MAELALPDDKGYVLSGYCEKKLGNSGIVHVPYIPKTLSQEEWEKHEKMNRAGKTYAKVKRTNPNPSYRCKRGQIVEKSPTGYCLEIETVNTVSDSGFSTMIGVLYPHGYKKIWFNADEVEDFESYDENGEQQKGNQIHEY